MRLALIVALLLVSGCSADTARTASDKIDESKKLIYFGFDDHSETRTQVLKMASDWIGHGDYCRNWQATVNEKDADYKILFGSAEQITVLGKRGEVVFQGGMGPLELPHGNPNGSGTNLCRLTGGG